MSKPALWEDELDYRRAVLRVMVIIVIAFCAYATVANFKAGNTVYAAMELLLAVLSAGLLHIHKKTERLTLWSSLFLFACFDTVVAGAYVLPIRAAEFTWMSLIPVLSYLLLGLQLGRLFSFIYITLGIGVLLLRAVYGHDDMSSGTVLNISCCVLCIWALSHVYESMRAAMVARLQKIAAIDPLTGLHNRLHLDSVFRQLSKGQRDQSPAISMVLIDLDHFKAVNDNYGHDGGDAVLARVAVLMTEICRAGDWAFRFGGEEFCLLIPGISTDQAMQIAERLRSNIEQAEIVMGSRRVRVSASIGVARWPDDAGELNALYKIVDRRLYDAKNGGRNRVVGAPLVVAHTD